MTGRSVQREDIAAASPALGRTVFRIEWPDD
jgi:hypothetical protein